MAYPKKGKMENLNLIDWKLVGFGSLWILGLSVILSVFGFVDFYSKQRGIRFREELRRPNYHPWINLGLVLFCLGLLGSSEVWWETGLWGLLAAAFAWFSVQSFREVRSLEGEEEEESEIRQ
jgi:hypothetical protein